MVGLPIDRNKLPVHVAFIMDGNGRWAQKRGLPRYLGHKAACERLASLLRHCRDLGIKVTSFFAFSTENWNRPQDEIDHLMEYLRIFFEKNIGELMANDTKVYISGERDRLPKATLDICDKAVDMTKNNKRFAFNICLNYGGRDEIVRAARHFASDCLEGKAKPSDLTEQSFRSYLFAPDLPDVDLLIRTSGEERLSNYLLYEIAYAEFVFADTYWPDFDGHELDKCLIEFAKRNRRFGGLSRG